VTSSETYGNLISGTVVPAGGYTWLKRAVYKIIITIGYYQDVSLNVADWDDWHA